MNESREIAVDFYLATLQMSDWCHFQVIFVREFWKNVWNLKNLARISQESFENLNNFEANGSNSAAVAIIWQRIFRKMAKNPQESQESQESLRKWQQLQLSWLQRWRYSPEIGSTVQESPQRIPRIPRILKETENGNRNRKRCDGGNMEKAEIRHSINLIQSN